MNKQQILQTLADSVRRKHPWQISEKKYISLFGELPRQYLEERQHIDNLLEKMKKFQVCTSNLDNLTIEIKLSLEELCRWELELDKNEESRAHNITPGDIKKLLK